MPPKIEKRVLSLFNTPPVEEVLPPPPKPTRSSLSRLFGRAAWFAMKIGILIGISGYLYLQSVKAYEWGKGEVEALYAKGLEYVTVERVVTEYKEPTKATLDEIIRKVSADVNIDPLILGVILDKESAGGRSLYRFEKKKFEENVKEDTRKGLSEHESRMKNSSHGILHIMGYSARDYCGLKWSQLYDDWTSAKCAALIIKGHAEATKSIKHPGNRLWEIFKRYNGGGPDAEKYANEAMALVAEKLYKGAIKM